MGRSNTKWKRPVYQNCQWRLLGSLTRLRHQTENCSILKLYYDVWRQRCSAVTANFPLNTKQAQSVLSTHKKSHSSPKMLSAPTYLERVGQAECQPALLLSLSASVCLCAHRPFKPFELWPVCFCRASPRTRQLVALLLHGVSWLLDRCLMTASLVTPVASLVRRLPASVSLAQPLMWMCVTSLIWSHLNI